MMNLFRYLKGVARIRLGVEVDHAFHECGHALLFSVLRGLDNPIITVVAEKNQYFVSHDLPDEFMKSAETRRWVMLVCLAGRAAEIAADRNAKLMADKHFTDIIDSLSEDNGDGRRWTRFALKSLKDDNIQGDMQLALDIRQQEDMRTLNEFFTCNLSLLKEFAKAVINNGGRMSGSEVDVFLNRVEFTDRVSPALLAGFRNAQILVEAD